MTRVPVSLSDSQLQAVMTAAASLPPEKRDTFLQRVAARLRQRSNFHDGDVSDVCALSLKGLVFEPAA